VIPIKIFMMADHLVQGGLETHIITNVNQLTSLGHEVILHTASCNESILKQINPTRFQYLPWSEDPQRIIDKFKPDILHSHPFTAIVKAAEIAERNQLPLVVTMHGLYDFGFDDSPLGNAISKKVKRIIAVDFRVAVLLLNNVVEPEKVSVIRNGIDFKRFYPKEKKKDKLKKLGLDPNKLTITIVSRFADDKEIPIIQFLKCAPDIAKNVKGLNVLLIGDGVKMKDIQDAIPIKDHRDLKIKVLGWQEGVEDFYRMSDLVLGSGRVALEALSCKIPVYSMWDGFGGLITKENHDSVMMGNAFRKLSDDELTKEIVNVLKNENELTRSAKESYDFVRKIYDLKKCTNQLVRLYEQYL
jgi:glycosyltransferase involved in cell wall biosynthesis